MGREAKTSGGTEPQAPKAPGSTSARLPRPEQTPDTEQIQRSWPEPLGLPSLPEQKSLLPISRASLFFLFCKGNMTPCAPCEGHVLRRGAVCVHTHTCDPRTRALLSALSRRLLAGDEATLWLRHQTLLVRCVRSPRSASFLTCQHTCKNTCYLRLRASYPGLPAAVSHGWF